MLGIGVEQNDKKAFQCFEKAANAGIAVGQYNLAVMYLYGSGVEKNEEKGMEWLKKAAQQEFAPAVKALENNEL